MLTKKIHTKTRFFTNTHIHSGRIAFRQILHIHSLGGRNDIFESPSKLVEGFWEGEGAKFGLSHCLWHWLLTMRIALPRIRVIVTHMLHMSAKNILSCALVISDCYYLPPLSQLRFMFTNELSTSSIVVLCSDQKFINVSHEKIDIKIELFSKIESKLIETKKAVL